MSFGDLALSRAKSRFLSHSAWFGWILALEPVLKNWSTPLCRKLFTTRIVYIIAIHVGKQAVRLVRQISDDKMRNPSAHAYVSKETLSEYRSHKDAKKCYAKSRENVLGGGCSKKQFVHAVMGSQLSRSKTLSFGEPAKL
jgi:hypothetical protein